MLDGEASYGRFSGVLPWHVKAVFVDALLRVSPFPYYYPDMTCEIADSACDSNGGKETI